MKSAAKRPTISAISARSLLQELVALTGATVRESENGQVTVTAGGLLLVGNERFATLSSDVVGSNGLHAVTYHGPDGTAFDATGLFRAAKSVHWSDTRDTQVQGTIDELDLFAKTWSMNSTVNMRLATI